jgi:CheY-like chemotaxis protein/HPt (histidine-containing phosphotransfer) domain-containing protein
MIMISSAVRAGDAEHCRELGIVRHMTKPIVQSELLETLLAVVGEAVADDRGAHGHAIAKIDEQPKLRILLAEDGLINQRVAVGLLEAHGHIVIVANNGREAVDELANDDDIDLVLMDLQMPVMDGMEATIAIREHEKQQSRHTPIIAMTAAAMKGDREKCLQVGMDGYVSKPVDPEQLFNTLDEFAPDTSSRTADAVPGGAEVSTIDVIDLDVAQARICGGFEAVKEVAQLLLEECPKLLAEIREGLASSEAVRVERGAHTLKSSADIFAAKRVVTAARRLEELAREGDLSSSENALGELEIEVKQLMDAANAVTNTASL